MNAVARIDFAAPDGMLRRRLHSSGFMPDIAFQNIHDFSDAFRKLHFLEARTHDQALANPGERVVDTHFVFPNLRADPADPANYFFAATDHLLGNCRACGTQIMYRLGTSIEHTKGRHFNAVAPDDFEHYAEVMAGIVRHYNHGWADGFHWGIPCWEVWNEPDLGELMWNASMEEYHRLYAVVAKRLKAEFPEIKIGGPALCGLNEPLIRNFLAHCRDHGAPVDFLSWHCYTSDVDKIVALPVRARELLDACGFEKTETMLNEWHYLLSWEGLHRNVTPEGYEKAICGPAGMHGIDSAAFNASVIARWHDTPLDSAYYYGCGLTTWGFLTLFQGLNKNYHGMRFVGELMTRFPNRVKAEAASPTISLLAGTDGAGRIGILVADYRGEGLDLALDIAGLGALRALEVQRLDQASDPKPVEASFADGRLVLRKASPGSAVFFITG